MINVMMRFLVLGSFVFLAACGGGGGSSDGGGTTAPTVSIASAYVVEGNSGTSNLVFDVSMTGTSSQAVTVDYATSDGTALAASDYTATTGTLSIAAGSSTGTITVPVNGDTLIEANETLTLTLTNPANATLGTASATGTIANDEAAPTVSIAPASVAEGDTGTSNLVFDVSISAVSSQDVTVDYATSDGTALEASDYTATTGTLTITAGNTTGAITVPVSGDTLIEEDETLTLTLTNPANATLGTASAIGTITNDDAPGVTASLSVSGKSLDFSWAAVGGTDHYRILVNPDGASGFSVDPAASSIANTETSFSLEIPVHKTNWLSAQYIVESCDAGELNCLSSANQTLALIDSVAATIYVKASNTENNSDSRDRFGYSVSMSGDGNTLAVSAFDEESAATGIDGDEADNTVDSTGAVYVFARTGGSWAQQAYLKSSSNTLKMQTWFGSSVSLSDDGNTLAVGAYGESSNATGTNGNELNDLAPYSGAVYVFTRATTTWTQSDYLKATNSASNDRFGKSVSLSGDGFTLAVGSTGEDGIASASGAVYVFIPVSGSWTQQGYVKASNPGVADQFGWSVSLSFDGNTLAVGAYSEDSNSGSINIGETDNSAVDSGAAYVFTRTVATWTQQAYVKAFNTDATDNFGWSVSLSDDGDTLAVGAYAEDSNASGGRFDNTATDSGAVYVFTRASSTWTQQAYLKASNTDAGDRFGWSLSLSSDGNTLAVGAYLEASNSAGVGGNQSINTFTGSGAAYVFTRAATTWTQQAYVKASNTGSADFFGRSISLSDDGDTLAVAGEYEGSSATGVGGDQTDNTAFGAGAVYLY